MSADVSSFSDALSLDFVRHALVAGVAASVLCGVIGVFVVVKRWAFISGGISHAAFAGLGLCYYLGADPRLGAVGVGLLCALVLGGAAGRDGATARNHDALIGVLYAAGMALGIVLIHATPGYAPNLMTYLFGDILLATRADVVLTVVFSAAVLTVVAVLFKSFAAVAFDEVFAFVQGVPVRFLLTLLLALVAITVVLLIQVVGIVLVIALLTIPPLTALTFARDLRGAILGSVLIGVAITLGGLAASYRLDLPTGPAIVLLGTAVLGLVRAYRRTTVRGRGLS